jgi:hypothetical protein
VHLVAWLAALGAQQRTQMQRTTQMSQKKNKDLAFVCVF